LGEHEFPVEDDIDIALLEGGDDLRKVPSEGPALTVLQSNGARAPQLMQRLVD
jgi:hypothetical protein